jgi:hypothetical protein
LPRPGMPVRERRGRAREGGGRGFLQVLVGPQRRGRRPYHWSSSPTTKRCQTLRSRTVGYSR